MATPTFAPPAPPRAAAEPQRAARPRTRIGARPARERYDGRVWRWALVASVALHLLVLLLSPGFVRVGAPPGDEADLVRPPGGTPLVQLPPVALPPVAVAPTPAEVAPDAEPLPVPPSSGRVAPPATTAPVAPTPRGPAAEGPAPADNPLRPGLRDPRLWVAPRELPPEREPTHEELHARYMAQLEARLNALNDSIAGDAERARRATDWTVTDKSGRRWGISPEGIHLGGVTLPPMTFPPGGGDPDKRRQAEEQERTRSEIDRQQADQERRRILEERARATRERRDAERRGDP
jgi:hypothetical protein